MDAITTPQSETSIRQSLLSRWRNDCSELQKLYAKLEVALADALLVHAQALASTPPVARTFGNKISGAFKGPQSSKAHADLVPLRNLLAHANTEVVQLGGEWSLVLRVADLASAMNARIIPEKHYKRLIVEWKKMLNSALDEAAALPAQASDKPSTPKK